MDIGTAKPTAAERAAVAAPPGRRRRPVGGLVRRPVPDRGAGRGRRHRGARPPGAAGRRHRPLRAGRRRRPPLPRRGPRRCGPSSRRATARARRARRAPTRSSAAPTRWPRRGSSRTTSRRIVRALEVIQPDRPAVLVVRSRRRRLRPSRCSRCAIAGVWLPRAVMTARGSTPALRGDARRPGCVDEVRRLAAPAAPGCRAPPARRSATRRSSPTCDGRSPSLDAAFDAAVRRTRALRPPPAHVVPARSPHHLVRRRARKSRTACCPHSWHAGAGHDGRAREAPRHRQRLPRVDRPTAGVGADAVGGRPSRSATATGCRRRRPDRRSGPAPTVPTATMTLLNADGGLAEMSGNGDALPRVGRACATGLGDGERLVVDTGGGRRDGRPRPRSAPRRASARDRSTWARSRSTPRRSRSTRRARSISKPTFHGHDLPRRRGRDGQPAPRALRRRRRAPRASPSTGPRSSTTSASRSGRTSSSSSPGPSPTRLRMRVWERGVGRDAVVRHRARARPRRSRTAAGSSATGSRVHVPGGDLDVELGDTIRLGGPVVHVFDVDVDLGAGDPAAGGQSR